MIQRLQNAAARIIAGNYDYINFREEDLVKQIKWETVKQRITFTIKADDNWSARNGLGGEG